MFKGSVNILDPNIPPIIIGIVLLLGSCVVPLFIDKLGRKVLLLFGSVGMALSQVLILTLLGMFKDNFSPFFSFLTPFISTSKRKET